MPLSVIPLRVYIPPARCPSWSWISFCPCSNDLSKLITTLPCISVIFHLTFALLVLNTLKMDEVSTRFGSILTELTVGSTGAGVAVIQLMPPVLATTIGPNRLTDPPAVLSIGVPPGVEEVTAIAHADPL